LRLWLARPVALRLGFLSNTAFLCDRETTRDGCSFLTGSDPVPVWGRFALLRPRRLNDEGGTVEAIVLSLRIFNFGFNP
jgi:hypothetical protein